MIQRAWRIVKENRILTAWNGEGSRLFGGRWNSRGVSVVYTSGSRALAALETLVHLLPPVEPRFTLISVDFDSSWVEILASTSLPLDWMEQPVPLSTQRIGDAWMAAGRTLILEVPSVIVTRESNYLINPFHPQFKELTFGTPESFSFDSRLI